MKNQSRTLLFSIAVVLIIAVNNNCFEYLSNLNFHPPQTLFYRGIFSFILATIYALFKKQPFLPTSFKLQYLRLITTGGSLSLVLFSYDYLAAGTVSLLQRLDIPLLIFTALIIGRKKPKIQVAVSALTVIIILCLAVDPSVIQESYQGFLLIFFSLFMTVSGYLMVHNDSGKESVPALVNVAAISSVVFGLVLSFAFGYSLLITPIALAVLFVSALLNVALFIVTIELYKVFQPERALFPSVLAIFSTSLMEMLIEKKMYSLTQLAVTFGLTALLSCICLTANSNKTTLADR